MNYFIKKCLLFPMNVFYMISKKKEIELMFYLKHKKKLNLDNPCSYNEKINWIKLYYENDLMSVCSDKYLVRQYVVEQGCGHILNELIWSGYNPEDIPFDELPNKFVIKTTHGSGFNIICKDKNALSRKHTIKQLKRWLKQKYLKCYGEHWYSKERPRIVIEKFLENNDQKPLYDYKFFCFDGEPKYLYVDTWKDGQHHINTYDIDFNLRNEVSMGYPRDYSSVELPKTYNEMIEVAKKLSAGFPHVRVDLYSVNDKIKFGEMTFSKGAGFDKIEPYEFDLELGEHFRLPHQEDRFLIK